MARPASRSMPTPAPPSRALPWVAVGRLAVGLILLAASTALIAVPIARASSTKTA